MSAQLLALLDADNAAALAELIHHNPDLISTKAPPDGSLVDYAIAHNADACTVLLLRAGGVFEDVAKATRCLESSALAPNVELTRALLRSGGKVQVSVDLLVRCVLQGDEEMLGVLLDAGAGPGPAGLSTCALWCAVQGAWRYVPRLVEAGADPDVCDEEGENKTMLYFAVTSGDLQAAQSLLEYGAKVDWADGTGQTLLHIAASMGMVEMMRVLIGHGASTAATDDEGLTPLIRATQCCQVEAARELLAVDGIEVDARDNQGRTALMHSAFAWSHEIAVELLKHGASPWLTNNDGETASELAAITSMRDVIVDGEASFQVATLLVGLRVSGPDTCLGRISRSSMFEPNVFRMVMDFLRY